MLQEQRLLELLRARWVGAWLHGYASDLRGPTPAAHATEGACKLEAPSCSSLRMPHTGSHSCEGLHQTHRDSQIIHQPTGESAQPSVTQDGRRASARVAGAAGAAAAGAVLAARGARTSLPDPAGPHCRCGQIHQLR